MLHPTLRRLLPVIALLGSAAAPATADPYQVVLMDGRVVRASSRPLIAMGKVSFLDDLRSPQALSTGLVNIEATRARLGRATTRSRVWTGASMAALGEHDVQYVGDAEAAVVEPSESDEAPAVPTGDAQANMLRNRIQEISEQVRTLSSKDRQRTLLILHQLELQQELSRLLSVPQQRS